MINLFRNTAIGPAGTLAIVAATPSPARVVVADHGYGPQIDAGRYGGYPYAPSYGSRSRDIGGPYSPCYPTQRAQNRC